MSEVKHLSPHSYQELMKLENQHVIRYGSSSGEDIPLTYCGLYHYSWQDWSDKPTVPTLFVRFADEEDPRAQIENPILMEDVTCEACLLLYFVSQAEETQDG